IAKRRAVPAFFGRVAIGGWGSGTKTVADWCRGLGRAGGIKKLVCGVYFFDGFDNTKIALVAGGPVGNLVQGPPRAKLRLICTAYTEREGIELARRLGNSEALDLILDAGQSPAQNDVRALPGRNDYFYTNPLYQDAFTLPAPIIRPQFRHR